MMALPVTNSTAAQFTFKDGKVTIDVKEHEQVLDFKLNASKKPAEIDFLLRAWR